MMLFNKKKTDEISEKEVVQKGLGFFHWIQEFSKRIVVISFMIYIIMDLISLAMVIISYQQTGNLMYIDTIISEANQTFRDVIGGYILKAATENISKGVCMILEKHLERKYNESGTDSSIVEDECFEEGDPE